MCVYWVLYIVVSILVSVMLANIDNSTWLFIFIHLSTNGSWVCKLPFCVHGDDVRRLLLSLAICLCLRLSSLACVLIFKSRHYHCSLLLLSSVTHCVDKPLNCWTWNCSFRILVVCYELGMWRFFFVTRLRSAERATSSLCGEQSGIKKCWRIMP